MEHILAQYSEERIREFADEGEESLREGQRPLCVECTDEYVTEHGDTCPRCVTEDCDVAAIAIMRGRALDVEVPSALGTIDRAIARVNAGRFHTSPVSSLVLPYKTAGAA